MLIAAAVVFIVFGTIEQIWTMVVWNIVIGSMHALRIVRDRRRERSVELDHQEQVLRDEFFPELSDFDFHLLWCMGEPATYTNEVVIEAGTVPQSVMLVTAGAAGVERNGERFVGVGRGGLLGEMSFVSDEPASTDVVAAGRLEVHSWDKRRLASLENVHPVGARAFGRLLDRNLTQKLRAS